MKGDIAMIILAAVILVTGIGLYLWIDGEAAQMIALCEQVHSADGPGQARGAVEQLGQRWDKHVIRWQFFAVHDDLIQISEAMIGLTHALEMEDMPQVKLNALLLREAIQTVVDKETPTARIVF